MLMRAYKQILGSDYQPWGSPGVGVVGVFHGDGTDTNIPNKEKFVLIMTKLPHDVLLKILIKYITNPNQR